MMPDQPHAHASATPTHLPALLPPTTTLLRRTQTTLGLLRDVVQESSAEYWYERGKKASAAEDWTEASYAFNQCLLKDDRHWRGALQLGSALVSHGLEAASASAILLGYDGPYPSWDDFVEELSRRQWIELHIVYSEQSENKENRFELLLAFALVLRARNESTQVRQILQDLQIKHKDKTRLSVSWHRLSGALWHEQNEFSKSLLDYNTAIVLNPTDTKIFTNRGILKTDMHDNEGALSDYNCAIDLDPFNALAHNKRGTVKIKLGNDEEALSDYNIAIALSPKTANYFFIRGIVRQFLEDSSGALADYNRTIELDSTNPQAYINRGLNKDYSGDYSGALADFEYAIELDPENAEIYNHRGRVKHSLENYVGALSDYNHAIILNPKHANAYANRAITKTKIRDVAGAKADNLMTAELMAEEALHTTDKQK